MSTMVLEVGAAAVGACIGSFLNVVIWRLPQEDPAKRSLGGRSRCPSCGATIRWSDNIPLFGWLKLGGKARCCGARISPRYPFVEVLTALLFWALAHFQPYGPVFTPAGLESSSPLVFDGMAFTALVLQAFLLAVLVACTFIDLDHRLLPDALTMPAMTVGVGGSLFAHGLAGTLGGSGGGSPAIRSALASVVGLCTGAGVTWGIRAAASRIFKREAMGLGDVKFLGAIGAFLGWKGALLSLFLGCVGGAIVGIARLRRGALIPFGPFLALGAVLTLFFEERITSFLFETWPEWQRDNPSAPWLLLGSSAVALVALVVFVRRGRRQS